nr:LuxR C-terminal-related transcriptional regulator [Micromonospora sp. DSM 115978]
MADLPATAADIAAEINWIAAQPGEITERAEALRAPLRRLIPFDGYFLALLDPDRLSFVTLAVDGYADSTSDYLASEDCYREVELVGLHRPRTPIRLRDCPVPPEELVSWAVHLAPYGFREGVGIGLFDRGQTHRGILCLHTRTVDEPTDEARDLLGVLAPSISQAVDPLRAFAPLTRLVGRARAGVVLTRHGTPLTLDGLPTHPALRLGSPALTAAAQSLAHGQSYASFLWPGSTKAVASCLRIVVLAVPNGTPGFLSAIVLICPTGDLHGLTPRELEVVSLLIEGWSNQRIAETLYISERTVAAHIEHILTKLAAPSRTIAAVRAVRLGLYIPRTGDGQKC